MQNNFDNNSLLCSSECSPPISIASSSTLICTNSTTYLSVPSLGTGITYNWSVGSGLTIVSGSGTNQIGVKAVSGYSTGTVNLSIKNSNGCTFNIPSKTLTLGDNWYLEGTLSSIPGSGSGSRINTANAVPIGTTYIDLTTPGVTSYTWSLTEGAPSGWGVTNGSGTQAWVNLQSGQHARFDLVGYTNCSSKSTFFIVYATSSATYAVYPNPASSELNIEQVQTDGNAITVAAGSEREVDITLFDKNGKKLKTGKGKNGKLVLDVHDLPNDTYILHVNDGKEVFKHQIVIDRSK